PPGLGVPRRPAPRGVPRLGALAVAPPPQRLPAALEPRGFLSAPGVVDDQLLPEGLPPRELVVPGQAMEPEEEPLRTGRGVAPLLAQGGAILLDAAAAPARPVEADLQGVRPVVVRGRPVGAT